MAYDRLGSDTVTYERKVGTSVTTGSRSRTTSITRIHDNTSGGYITFPDGSTFRRPTAHSRRHARIEPGSGQLTTGQNSQEQAVEFHADGGGYRSDILLTSNCPPFSDSITGVSKLYGFPSAPVMMKNEASTKALLDIANQKAQHGENLATFGRTLKLVRTPARLLEQSLRVARNKGSFRPFLRRTARDILDEASRKGGLSLAAEQYLKVVYGWKPLMQDIYGSVELMKQLAEKPLLVWGQGVSKQQIQAGKVRKIDISYNATTDLGPLDVQSKVTCKIWARIDPEYAFLRSLNQLGLLNPASLAWDLVPYSFVVDWFIPIGNVLNALSARAGLIFVAGTQSIKVDIVGPYDHWYNAFDAYADTSKANGTAVHSSYDRKTLSTWPMPGFYVNTRFPLSGDRSLKALALGILNLRR